MSGRWGDDLASAAAGAALAAMRNGAHFLYRGLRGRGWSPAVLMGGHEQILVPGDRSPDGDVPADFRDYRGIAEPRELRHLVGATGFPVGRYLLPNGAAQRRLYLPLQDLFRHCAVIGPPGSGKTKGVMVPWIEAALTAGASVVTVDVKGDLSTRLRPGLATRSWRWSPMEQGIPGSWNWMASLSTIQDVEAAVGSILGRKSLHDPNPFFHDRDVRWLRALIRAIHRTRGRGAVPGDLYALAGDQGLLIHLFHGNPALQDLAGDLADLLGMPPDEHSRAVSGLLNALHVFELPSVKAATTRSDFELSRIDETPTLLTIGAPLHGGAAAATLSGVILGQLISVLYRRFEPGRRDLARPVYLILDEAPRYHERIGLEDLLAVCRSGGVGVCVAAQDVTQFGDRATTLLANCSTLMILPGASAATARAFAAGLGQRCEREISVGRESHPLRPFPRGEQRSYRAVLVPVLQEREIMHPPVGPFCATIQVKHVSEKPFLVDLRR